MKKIIAVGFGLLICVMLVATISPIGNYPMGVSEIESRPIWVSEIGVSKIAVSGLGTLNDTEERVLESIPTVKETIVNSLNCSGDIVFVADDFYKYINKTELNKFTEEYETGDCVWEIHDCDDIAMEFSVNIRKEFSKQEFVPAVGVVWTEDHATNFWISDDKNHTIWVFDMADKKEYSIIDHTIKFVYI